MKTFINQSNGRILDPASGSDFYKKENSNSLYILLRHCFQRISEVNIAITKMEKIVEEKTVQVKWSRRQYSEVSRSDIIEPSPIRPGQKVTVIWGNQKKEHTAIVECYPMEPKGSQPTECQDNLQVPRRKAKRKLVSNSLL